MNSQLIENQDNAASMAGKYLAFRLENEGYGLEILKVQEIIGMQEITKIPGTPAYVKGVINLRGKIIPIIDLRRKFGIAEQEINRKTCIIVAQIEQEETSLIIGVIVDEVSEVLDISKDMIESPPSLGATVDTRFILGMAKTESAVKILLDIDRVLSSEDFTSLRQAV